MRLYIMRHGETPWNIELRLQGQTDIDLNEKGQRLAQVTADALGDIPFDLAITSPLGRAKETARIVLAGRKVPILEDSRLREIGFGVMEGRRLSDQEKHDPGSEFFCFFHDPEHYVPAEGGESIVSLCGRAADFLRELKGRQEWKDRTILVSTHGAASRGLILAIKGTPMKDFWENGVPKNCAVTTVDLEDGEWIIREQDVVYYEDV